MAALRRTAAGIRMSSVIGLAIGIGIGLGVAGGRDTKESMAIAIPTPKACLEPCSFAWICVHLR